MVDKKKWTGIRTTRKKHPVLIGDSYQSSEEDLKKMRAIAKREGISKAQIIRYGIKLALAAYKDEKTKNFDVEGM